jgi:hypothetical protein
LLRRHSTSKFLFPLYIISGMLGQQSRDGVRPFNLAEPFGLSSPFGNSPSGNDEAAGSGREGRREVCEKGEDHSAANNGQESSTLINFRSGTIQAPSLGLPSRNPPAVVEASSSSRSLGTVQLI